MDRFAQTANLLTVVQTCRRQGRSVMEFFRQALMFKSGRGQSQPSLIHQPTTWILTIFIVDQLNIHKSESLVCLMAKRCGIDTDLGIKEKSGILKSTATRESFLSDSNHRIRFVYIPKHTSWRCSRLNVSLASSCVACSSEVILPQHQTSNKRFSTLLLTTTTRWLNHFYVNFKATLRLARLVGYFYPAGLDTAWQYAILVCH